MDGKDWAIVIAALGTLGIPILLLMFTVGGLVFGFALWSILGFLSSWMIPLIFFGAGVIALIELAPHGLYGMLIGVGALLFAVFFGYVLWSGALAGPTNTYSILLSATGSSSSIAVSDWAFFVIAVVLAVAGLGYVLIKEIRIEMEAKTAAIFGIIAVILAGALIAIGSIPTSAYSGGQPTTVCTLKLSASGTYNDLLVEHYVSDFAVTGGGTGCHTQTLLDLVPASQFNLFPVTLTFSVVLTSQSDGSVHGPYDIPVHVGIGAAAPSYPFNVEISVANVPQGTYSAAVQCPVTCVGSSTTYTTTINV